MIESKLLQVTHQPTLISDLPDDMFPILGKVIDPCDNGDHIILWITKRCGTVVWRDDPSKLNLAGTVFGWDCSAYKIYYGIVQLENRR